MQRARVRDSTRLEICAKLSLQMRQLRQLAPFMRPERPVCAMGRNGDAHEHRRRHLCVCSMVADILCS